MIAENIYYWLCDHMFLMLILLTIGMVIKEEIQKKRGKKGGKNA